jgi:hypothetical protein
MLSKQFIQKILISIHPANKITLESINILKQLFSKFDNLTSVEIIQLIPENYQLHQFAIKEANKMVNEKDRIKNILKYLLAEILELSGNCARDNKLIKINANCIWVAIFNDAELVELFKNELPSIGPYHILKDEIYYHYGNICKYNLNKIQDILKTNEIIYEPIIIKRIQYILNYFTNKCTSSEELEKQIKLISPHVNNISIQNYHQLILNKLIDKMKTLNKKINYTLLNDIFTQTFPNEKFFINY